MTTGKCYYNVHLQVLIIWKNLTTPLDYFTQRRVLLSLQRFSGFLQQKSVERKAKTVERHTIIAQFAQCANDDTPTRKQH